MHFAVRDARIARGEGRVGGRREGSGQREHLGVLPSMDIRGGT